jgi:acetate kinase
MKRTLLAVNAGSGTLKTALFTFEAEPRLLHRDIKTGASKQRVDELLADVGASIRDGALAAVGHRIVHGGPDHHEPQRVSGEFLADLARIVPFAPNHLPAAIELIERLQRAAPDIPHVACFDTAFHHRLPDVARRLPIPLSYDQRGIHRYGFHGLSYAYLMDALQHHAPELLQGNVVLAHLGNGSSLAAVRGGWCVDTTMGFTPLGGVIMSTRSGDIDPGLVAFIAREQGWTADRIEEFFSHESGLRAVSGVSGDMRELLDREDHDEACRLAVNIYAYQIKKCIGAYAAAMGGLDAIVFSGGIGEHAPDIRRRIATGLEFLGVHIDDARNDINDRVISSGRVAVHVIPTDEELMIARLTYGLLSKVSP